MSVGDGVEVGHVAHVPHRLTLLTKPGCHLCDDARTALRGLAVEFGVVMEERDITADPVDYRRWADWIPVTLLDGEEYAVFAVDEERLRRALEG